MNARMLRGVRISCAFLCSLAPIAAQKYHVDPRNMYQRVLAVVSWAGGTHGDPKRPMYAPAVTPTQIGPPSRNGILGFQCIPSDDGKLALCEFVAKGNALKPILADPAVKSFLKGRDKIEDAVTMFKKYKKDFDINRFGVVRVP